MSATPAWFDAIAARLAAEAPRDVLLIAPAGDVLGAALAARLPRASITRVHDPAALPADRRVALAVVCGMLEALDAAAARTLLAALRDRAAQHTLVLVDLARSSLDENDLRALAYRAHARDGALALHGFDLHDYKDRPDWLSPRDWAHPELWDKFRW